MCVPQGSQTKPLSLDSVAADFPMSNESQLSSQSGLSQPQMPPPTEADGAMHTMLDPIDAEADADDDASSSEDESVEGTDGDAQAELPRALTRDRAARCCPHSATNHCCVSGMVRVRHVRVRHAAA